MYPLIHELLSDRKGGAVFVCFGLWHWCYMLLAAASVTAAALHMRKMDGKARGHTLRRWIGLAFGLYIADFFLMPFAYEAIDMEKLPFHVCTATCVACFLSHRWERLKPWRSHLAMLAFVSNLVYLIYPAGVMWHQAHPQSYRVLQTLAFHGVMAGYGFLTLCFSSGERILKNWRKDLAVLVFQTGWAMLGNFLYNGKAGEYDHFFNWFFVVRDPFYLLPEKISPLVMPFLNVAVFFFVEMAVAGLFAWAKAHKTEKITHTG